MSKLTLRTALAVAGLAALGAGAAAPAFAVPALPPTPAPGSVTAPAEARAVSATQPDLSDLPDPFVFQAPSVHAGPDAPTFAPDVQTGSPQFGADSALQQLDGTSSGPVDADQ